MNYILPTNIVSQTKQILQTLLVRKALSNDNENNAKGALSGIKGEAEFAHWLDEFAQFGTITMRNLYLYFKQLCEFDFIIFTSKRWIIFEIKNTTGNIKIDGINFTVNGKAWGNHPLIQTRRAIEILRNIAQQINARVTIETVIIYMNEHAHVDYYGSGDNNFAPTVLSCGQVRNFLFSLKNELQYHHYTPENLEWIKQQILQYHSPKNYLESYYDDLQYDYIKLGINCPACRSFHLNLNYKTAICQNCQKKFSKNAILGHTIQEHQHIYRSEYLTASQIEHFIDGALSRRLIIDYLQKNYNVASNFSKKYYLPKA